MNGFDSTILLWLNHFSGWSGTVDAFIKISSDNVLVQGTVPTALLWYLWFRRDPPHHGTHDREIILITLVASICSIFFARWLAAILPYRERPMNEVALGFHNGHPEWGSDLYLWSSFPSDHAVLFFGLAMGIAMISRPLGYVAFLHAAIVDCIPRVYLGFHHPTDIIAGALIGVAGTWLFARLSALHTIAARLLAWAELRPAWFYAGLWLIVAEIATMFDSAVEILELGLNVVRTAYQHMA